jgi:uncharacterized protein YecT (DUF1311 family)
MLRVNSKILVLLAAASSLVGAQQQQPIRENEVEKWIAEQNDCGQNLDAIRILKLEAADFTHNGRAQAIVIAMSCNAGTAGPDVQSVLERAEDGKLSELKMMPVGRNLLEKTLFGPGSADLEEESNQLALRYTDSTDREYPLVIRYKWDGQQFAIAAVEKSEMFETSYNCAKTDEPIELAICYVKTLAELDRKLGALYRKRLDQAPAASKSIVREQQRKWIVARNDSCSLNDKWLVECLEKRYRQRLFELRDVSAANVSR